MGGLLTGSGTDPNTGPLVMLLALAMVPASASITARPPLGTLLRWSPTATASGFLAVAAAVALSASYPVAASESTAAAMSGMVMSGSGGSGATSAASATSAPSCSAQQNGLKISGLDLTNSPYMVMGGNDLGMDMNGADASAAGGFNTTKANWDYTGPPLPSALARLLLADGATTPRTSTWRGAAAPLRSPSPNSSTPSSTCRPPAPPSAGSQPRRGGGRRLPAGVAERLPIDVLREPHHRGGQRGGPAQPQPGPRRRPRLRPDARRQRGTGGRHVHPAPTVDSSPMPYGALVQWHRRPPVCGTATDGGDHALQITGYPPCAAGTTLQPTPYVTMVWQVPVAGGPLAIQPPDIQIVEAAVMQAQALSRRAPVERMSTGGRESCSGMRVRPGWLP